MNPLIHEDGNKVAIEYAQKAQNSGVTTMFNEDAQKSVDTFKFYEKYTFFHPDSNENDKLVFATLVRECVHFEVETVASMLTFGLDLNLVYPKITLSYMNKSCRAILKDKYPDQGIDDAFAENFARDLVQEVYNFIKEKLGLPNMSWNGVSASDF